MTAPVYSPFQRRYRSQATRLIPRRQTILLLTLPGFFYIGLGPIAFYVDGWRVGLRWRPR